MAVSPHPPVPRPGLGAELEWSPDGAPRSAAYDDIYFQPGDGLEEARAVFLHGCGLPEGWRGRRRFVVGELGFGCGLNILALMDLWRRRRTAGQRLHVFSVEAHPLSRPDAERALAAFPEMGELAALMLAQWPRQARGFHRLDFDALGVVLDVAVGEAAEALRAWAGRADAWFLDGFSPARNPQMWREEVLQLVADRSAPGARLATFTVARAVRRGLAECGFAVDKRPGHGRKRERLEARLPGELPAEAAQVSVVIVGGGIAGAALVRAAAAQGLRATVIADRPGASANPAALVTPAFDVAEAAGGRLHAQAFARATDLCRRTAPEAVIAGGVLQLEATPRDGPRFDRIAASALYAPGTVRRLDAAAVAERLGEPEGAGGLDLREALVVEPALLTASWLADAQVLAGRAAAMERGPGGWRVLDAAGARLAEADVVCLAAGAGLAALSGLPLAVVRGQTSWVQGVAPGPAAAWGGYAAPTRTGVLFGATHDRGDQALDVRAADDATNRATLAQARPRLAKATEGPPVEARASLRATTRDRRPVAGPVAGCEGLFILGGLGGRGFTTAPLLAEHLVALIVGAPSPLPADLAGAVDPQRRSLRPPAVAGRNAGPVA